MKSLVTGAGGYIGGYLCRRLSQTDEVVAVARRSLDSVGVTSGGPSNLRWRQADLAKCLSVDEDIDVVVHTAACTPGDDVTLDDYISSNVLATNNLVGFAVQNRLKRFIHLSAMSVYGRIDVSVVNENTPINGPGPYGLTKYVAECLLRQHGGAVPSVILRLPVVVGPGMSSGWIYGAYQTLKQGQALRIYNGDSPYNMVHLADVYDLVHRSMSQDLTGSEVFTASCTDFMSVREIVDAIRAYTGSTSEVSEERTDQVGFKISSEKATRLLGYAPRPADEILASFLEGTDPVEDWRQSHLKKSYALPARGHTLTQGDHSG